MKLKKETYECLIDGVYDADYSKEYDVKGNLIYHSERHQTKHLFYNEKNKLTKEIIETHKDYGEQNEIIENKYEYYDNGYRISSIRVQIIDDSYTTESLGSLVTEEQLTAKYPRKVNNLIKIQEVLLDGNNILSIKTSNFKENKFSSIEFIYQGNNLILEKNYSLNNNKVLISTKDYLYDSNDRIIKSVIYYPEDNTTNIIEFEYLPNKTIESFKVVSEIYDNETITKVKEFDDKDRLIKENTTQYLFIENYDEKHNSVFSEYCIEGEVNNNNFEILGKTKFEYYN